MHRRNESALTWLAPAQRGHARHHAHSWARRWALQVLVLWGLCVAVAVASPLIKPHDLQLICSAAGRVLWVPLDVSADDSPAAPTLGSHSLDCPLCAAPAAPPPVALAVVAPVQRLGYALHRIEASPVHARYGLLPPARGPPALV